ncbi:uncharacterized protein LOC114930309 [Nylanderia fulva]|uniref:uncharacterized protein LOC114930309 n=1 Tax=Nylanderia fulva TaxID=613905 RepID=UPI0010FB4581|nr:uncharacterized protein LOC114930309 [Nylanderia fulva]
MDDDGRVFSKERTPVVATNVDSENCEISKCHSEKCTRNEENTQIENVAAICIESSDEDDASERTSSDVERRESMENQLPTNLELSIDCEKKFPSALLERAQRLSSEMTSLREKLNKEMALWRKEKEEFQNLRERSDALAFEEATAAARAAAAAYAMESPLSRDLSNIVDLTSEQSVRADLAILEYEKNLAKYQNSYSFEQAEQRYNSYKRALFDAYKQRLLEVERLCDEELENIQQNANCLQPFKEIASQWTVDKNDRGDSQRVCNDQSKDLGQSKIVDTINFGNDWRVYGKIDNEVNMMPEILCSRFHREEAT